MIQDRTGAPRKAGSGEENEALRRHVAELNEHIAALEHDIQALLTDSVYSSADFRVLTRSGIERRWRQRDAAQNTVIFVDLDDLRAANSAFGYDEANRRIATGLAVGGSSVVCGRWFSGDEIVYLCNQHDADGLATRLQHELATQGLSATIGISSAGDDLLASVSRAALLVQDAKAQNRRGAVYVDWTIDD